MTPVQLATLNYWKQKYPAQFAQALAASGVVGFGQTSTFNDIMGSLTGVLTSYGQYRVASQIADSGNAANRNVLSLPGSGTTGTTNWILYGGIALVALVAIGIFMKKRK